MVVRICLLGFGEVGQILAADIKQHSNAAIAAYDILFADSGSIPSQGLSNNLPLIKGESAATAVAGCDVVISAVTAEQTYKAAESVVPGLKQDAWFIDLNSASPGIKVSVAKLVDAAGARYVEAAIMSPFPPKRLNSPVLIGGAYALESLEMLQSLGFSNVAAASEDLGKASAAKMCRSVIVKGIEALLLESLLAARCYGVEQSVLDSLQDLFPGIDWPQKAAYMIARSIEHGDRRAEEMREVSRSVEEVSVMPLMSDACAQRQALAAQYTGALQKDQLTDMLDVILGQIQTTEADRE